MKKGEVKEEHSTSVRAIASVAASQLTDCLSMVDDGQLDGLVSAIVAARRVYVYGAGRSMLMLRCLAMRLMHLGLTSYVVGDTTAPAFVEGDLLIVASGSGSTPGVVNVAAKAKELEGRLALITVRVGSPLSQMADVLVEIFLPGAGDDREGHGKREAPHHCDERPILPGGSLFEQATLLIADALTLPLGELRQVPTDRAFSLNANLE